MHKNYQTDRFTRRDVLTYTFWAASILACLHFSLSIRYATDATATEVATTRRDLRELVASAPAVIERTARRSASGAVDETFVRPVRDSARTAKSEVNAGLRRAGISARF